MAGSLERVVATEWVGMPGTEADQSLFVSRMTVTYPAWIAR